MVSYNNFFKFYDFNYVTFTSTQCIKTYSLLDKKKEIVDITFKNTHKWQLLKVVVIQKYFE